MTARPARKRRRITNRPEQGIQIACVGYLRAALPGVVVWHTPNEGKRHPIEGQKLKEMGMLVGFPDVAFLHTARLHIAECKPHGEEPTAEQEACINALVGAGAVYLGVWRSINDVERSCRAAGLPVRAAALPGGGWARAA
jgi:hypothetical protein